MEAAIRSVQVGSGQQASSQQPQSDLSGARGTGPPHQALPPHSMSYQPRGGAGGINDSMAHRPSASNSSAPYQQFHSLQPSYDPRGRIRPPTTFSSAPTTGKASYSWQPANSQFEYSPRTSLHQPTIGAVPNSFVSANFHTGFPPARVTIPQQQQPPPSSQTQSVPNAQLVGSEYISSSSNIRDNAGAPRLQPQQHQQQIPRQSQTQAAPPDPGGQSISQHPIQPAYKKIRLGESYHQPSSNSLHHPTATPTSMPVRHHPGIQPNSTVVHVAPQPQQRAMPNPPPGQTAEIQYQQPKPQVQHVPTAASPQAPQNTTTTKIPISSVLKIDTREPLTAGAGSGGYHPKTEAISPAGSPKLSKDDLLQQISSVDSSMMALEERKRILKEKERFLIEQKEDGTSVEVPEQPTFRHRTLAQQIYSENKKKATENHAILNALNFKGQTTELPLYNQPSDAEICRKVHEQYLTFRSSLLLHLRKIKSERAQRSQELADKYAKISIDWQKRVEKVENSVKRKAREARNRELFEKVFVELRKQREDKERFNRVGSRVKSEADFEVIVDGLQEQAQEDKKMRSYAVIPPIMFDSRQRRLVFHNENGSKVDMETELSAYKTVNLWTSGEKETFRDKYIQQAKNFGFIANHLERKSAQDCVRHYYLSKKDVKYKQLLRKSNKRTRSTKNLPKPNESQSLLDLMTSGVTTRLQRKSRNTTGRPTSSSSAAASANESQSSRSNAPLPTVTVTVKSGDSGQEVAKEEDDPLSMSETRSSPAPTGNARNNAASKSNDASAAFSSTRIKVEPESDVAMKTENDSNNWSPLNGLNVKHEYKSADIKQEERTASEDVAMKDESGKDVKKTEIKKESEDKENEDVKNKNSVMEINDDEWNDVEASSAKRRKIDESGSNEKDKNQQPYPCFVCKQESTRTRPLEKAKVQQFGIAEETVPNGARICGNCQSNKSGKPRFANTNCPMPTCPNSKDRVIRFRPLPSQLFEMPPEERDKIIKELQIPANVTKCCSVCLTRIRKKLGTHLIGTTPLTEDEIQQFRKQLQETGPKFGQLAEQLNKSATLLKTFYNLFKKKYGFDQAVNEYYKVHANEDRRPVTDGDESDVSVTSSDDNAAEAARNEAEAKKSEAAKAELEASMPTASVSLQAPPSKELAAPKTEPSSTSQNSVDDRLLPPLGQPPPLLNSQQIQNLSTGIPRDHLITMMRTKKHSEDYDSSATETADEENESSPANRQSPKAASAFSSMSKQAHFPQATTIAMSLQAQPQNGPPSNVHDAMLEIIERSLKSTKQPPKTSAVPPLKPNQPAAPAPADNNPDITFVGSYRHEGPNKIQIQPQRRSTSETLATLSIVNSHAAPGSLQSQQIIAGHPLNISSIAATITPVPPPQLNQQRPSSNPHAQEKDGRKTFTDMRGGMTQQNASQSEPEPQTLDLSIKKPQQQHQQQPERHYQSFAKTVPPPPAAGSIYRGDPSLQAQPNIPNQSNFMAFHPDMSRHPTKSPSNYIPPSLSPGQRGVLSMNTHLQQQQQQQQQQQSKGQKVTPKLSPKVHQQSSPSVQQLNGPKGSITLGTPLTDNRGQPIMIQGSSSTQSPRYDIMRQTPPSNDNKFGSITAGTPIHMGKVHDYMKNSRHSPATNQPPNVSSAGTGSPHPGQQYSSQYRPPSELVSTQALIFSDYLTSQQMPGHNQPQPRGGNNIQNTINIVSGPQPRGDKESPSPRGIAHSSSPASIYYADKERERAGSGQTRTEYLSRSSPADHQNNTPSPHRTPPPPQRQGVIQRHNTGGSKPPSPAPPRLSQSHFPHHYLHGHDALSNLVDVAVAQPSLPVPNDVNIRRPHIAVSSAESQSLPPPRERFSYLHPADVAALQQQHHQIEIFRRQQHHNREIQEYNERKERQEREYMQERERERDEAQRRMDVDIAQRSFERERLEQARYGQQVWRPGPGGRMQDEAIPFTAQCLINAIITENISRPAEPRDRFASRGDGRLQSSENNGNSHQSNVINVDVDSTDLSRHSQSSALPQKNIKLNDITDAVIAKDPAFGLHHPNAYHPHGQHFIRYSNANSAPNKTPPTQSHAPSGQPQLMGQDQIIATDQWKLNRRIQQQQQQHKEEMIKSGNNGGPQGRSTPDDRHIIRMNQSPSPRGKMAYEPVSPPEAGQHYFLQTKPMITINTGEQRKMPPGSVPTSQENAPVGDANMVLKFVNHKIAEAMRNNDEKYNSLVANEHHAGDGKEVHVMKSYERPRSGSSIPGNGIPDNDSDKSSGGKRASPSVYISQSTRPSPGPNQSFQQGPMSFHPMYPYSALTIPQAGANPIISPKAASELIDANRQSSGPQHVETRQVLSEQYDALSDED